MNPITRSLVFIMLCCSFTSVNAQEKKVYELATVAFYNLENLFDTLTDPDPRKSMQSEFTPNGKSMWNTARYQQKLENMSSVIAELGKEKSQTAPLIVGLSELENINVIQDLIQTENLNPFNYGIVHYESPDRRGIDVALIYRKDFVDIIHTQSYQLNIPERPSFRTRDQLLVKANLKGETLFCIVNHWPSRRGGALRSAPLRMAAAKLTRHISDSILNTDAQAKIIIMGDLNDNPTDKSVKKGLNTSALKSRMEDGQFYNPMDVIYGNGGGTGAYRDVWSLFDQLIISKALVDGSNQKWKFYKAGIFKKTEIIRQTGRYKNYPKRTFAGGKWIGGYSDHFPVYLYLIREQ